MKFKMLLITGTAAAMLLTGCQTTSNRTAAANPPAAAGNQKMNAPDTKAVPPKKEKPAAVAKTEEKIAISDKVFTDAVDRFKSSKHFIVVALGASNTERYMPGMHWLDVLEVGLRSRFGRKFHVIDSGISGNNTREALARFDRDVAFFKPSLVIVTLGGNDCSTNPKKYVPEAEYRANLEKIATRIRDLGAIPVFQTYYKMDLEAMNPEQAKGFVRNMEIVRELAKQHNWNFVDHYAVFDRVKPNVHRYKLMLNPMHTNEAGNLLIGIELLRHFGVNPYKIPHVEKLLPAIHLRESLD